MADINYEVFQYLFTVLSMSYLRMKLYGIDAAGSIIHGGTRAFIGVSAVFKIKEESFELKKGVNKFTI
jgi:hypothetical protein